MHKFKVNGELKTLLGKSSAPLNWADLGYIDTASLLQLDPGWNPTYIAAVGQSLWYFWWWWALGRTSRKAKFYQNIWRLPPVRHSNMITINHFLQGRTIPVHVCVRLLMQPLLAWALIQTNQWPFFPKELVNSPILIYPNLHTQTTN